MSASAMETRKRLGEAAERQEKAESTYRVINQAVLFGSLALAISLCSAYMAFDATRDAKHTEEEAEVLAIYVQRLHVQLEAQGFEPPPLPGDQ